MGHGADSTTRNAAKGSNAPPPPHRLDPAVFPGFGYLFGHPKPRQRSSLGHDIAAARTQLGALVGLLPPANPPVDSPIPAGYTYLLQFLAHDLVQTTVPLWAAADAGIASRNVRGPGLRLDTLYGGGPTSCPIAFTPAGLTTDDRSKLRLGRVHPGTPTANPEGACPFRDLARVNVHEAMRTQGYDVVNFDAAFQVCIADPRNDDSVILSQLTVLFSIVHNAIVDQLCSVTPALPPEALFNHARVALLHMYYNIIAKDLLPLILEQSICCDIARRSADVREWLWQGTDIPLEFSHGAYRVGHAMVRGQYAFNAGPPFTVAQTVSVDNRAECNNSFRNPLPESWVLEWARFFSFEGDPDFPSNYSLNYALKIAPRASSLDSGDLFSQLDPDAPDGVTLRDALSGAVAQMWTVDALVAKIRRRHGHLIPADWSFGDVGPGTMTTIPSARIRTWLTTLLTSGTGSPVQREVVQRNMNGLSRDLPLSLFVLLEAENNPDGKLGLLGSIIIGEVIGRLLATGMAELAHSVEAARAAIGSQFWEDQIQPIACMPAIIKFAARYGKLTNCTDMPFITSSNQQQEANNHG